MNPFTIQVLPETKLVGFKVNMSLHQNKTVEVWKQFMPRFGEIKHTKLHRLFSVQIFPSDFSFTHFDYTKNFEKWATTEVGEFESIPTEMLSLLIPSGLYAVFKYKGDSTGGEKLFRFIFEECLPQSNFEIDNRPHFEILANKYKREDSESEEEIWIPVKPKTKI